MIHLGGGWNATFDVGPQSSKYWLQKPSCSMRLDYLPTTFLRWKMATWTRGHVGTVNIPIPWKNLEKQSGHGTDVFTSLRKSWEWSVFAHRASLNLLLCLICIFIYLYIYIYNSQKVKPFRRGPKFCLVLKQKQTDIIDIIVFVHESP